jgi:hypothetical protein
MPSRSGSTASDDGSPANGNHGNGAAYPADGEGDKTRLLEVLELIIRQGLPTANVPDAALFRSISELTPTLLFSTPSPHASTHCSSSRP